MKKINIYDDDFKILKQWAEEDDTTIAEVLADVIKGYKIHVLDEE